jgi:DNA-binding LacI/PurR family transcriptional regulator
MKKDWRPRGRPLLPGAAYRKVADAMSALIASGSWAEGDLLPSYSRLSTRFGEKQKTIRLAVGVLEREGRLVRTGMGWRVPSSDRAAIKDNIVLIVLNTWRKHYFDNPNLLVLRKGLECELHKHGSSILLAPFHKRHVVSQLPGSLQYESLRGVLLHGDFTEKCLSHYEKMKIPVVVIDRPVTKHALSSVCVDNEKAAFDAVARLVAMGHRRIAFVRRVSLRISMVDPDSQERQAGFENSIKAAGLPSARSAIFNFMDGRSVAKIVATLRLAKPRFTAIVAADMQVAELFERSLVGRGYRVPEDMSIVCFSSVGSGSRWSGPHADFEKIGRKAVAVMFLRDRQQVRVPTVWNVGSTTAAAR